MLKQNDSGFSGIAVLLIVLIISVIGFGGYYVWSQNNKTEKTASSNMAEEKVADTNEAEELTNDTEGNAAKIEEFGIQINDPENRGITVSVIDVESPFDNSTKRVYAVYTPENDKYDEYCDVNAYISVSEGETQSIITLGEKTFYVGKTIMGCGDDTPGSYEYREDLNNYIKANLVVIE